ncbi:IPT/TIG domain-containing protein [Streptomyces sp. NPDC057638]|uniref:lipase family protein n=1 Tax=Streptomyces sp. NPDC057638 TaxID=3346190 RepID=UPI0036C0A5E1
MTTAPRSTPSDPTPAQVTMTLSAIAATAATPRPSGESQEAQALRMMGGIWTQLTDPGLATGAALWRLVWLGLSPDNANMAYIAQNFDGSNEFAVIIRGTIDHPVDMMEDLDVGTIVPFPVNGTALPVSAGAMAAFTQVVNAPGTTGTPGRTGAAAEPYERSGPALPIPSGSPLVQALAALLALAPAAPQPTVYVTGHSLGGAVATLLATHLQARDWSPSEPRFALFTFAAPTAGLEDFASYVDTVPWSAYGRYANAWDVVPLAWWNLTSAGSWFQDPPGPAATDEVLLLLKEIDTLRKGNLYVQPQATLPVLNGDYAAHDGRLVRRTTADYLGQLAYQHANATYLALLGAPLLTPGPVVTSLSTTTGDGGTPVTVTGTGFSAESVLDFGPIPCAEFSVDPSGTVIRALAPAGLGIVDVRVTNGLGTSPAVPLGQFAYGGLAPVVVSAVAPDEGTHGDPVTITGSGFADGAAVHFGKNPAEGRVHVEPPTQITAHVPRRLPTTADTGSADGTTVNVTVTVGVATSPTSPADEFTYEKD